MADIANISVQSNLGGLAAQLEGMFSARRINGIIASTITATAVEVQKTFKAEAASRFDRPKAFTLNSTYFTKATAQSLESRVGWKDRGLALTTGVPASEYLLPQIYGGSRRAKHFEYALRAAGVLEAGEFVTPGPAASMDAYGNQSPGQIARVLSFFRANRDVGYTSNRAAGAKSTGRSKKQFFVVNSANVRGQSAHLPYGIYERTASGVRLIMNVTRAPRYQVRLPIEQIARATIERVLIKNFNHYLADAYLRVARKSVAA